MVHGTFSPARAWCPAVVARLARTLGSANTSFPPANTRAGQLHRAETHQTHQFCEPPSSRAGHNQALPVLGSQLTKSDFSLALPRLVANPTKTDPKAAIGGNRVKVFPSSTPPKVQVDKSMICHFKAGKQCAYFAASVHSTVRICGSAAAGVASCSLGLLRQSNVGVKVRPAARLCRQRCLTLRSSGAPTAGYQARSVVRSIFHSPGLVPYRRRPLSSNVRPHKNLPANCCGHGIHHACRRPSRTGPKRPIEPKRFNRATLEIPRHPDAECSLVQKRKITG